MIGGRTLSRTAAMAGVTVLCAALATPAAAEGGTGDGGITVTSSQNGGTGGSDSGTGSVDTSVGVDTGGAPGSGSGVGDGSSSGDSGGSSSGSGGADIPKCSWSVVDPPPPASDDRWGGADPATHRLYLKSCGSGAELRGGTVASVDVEWVVGEKNPPAPPPPDPADLASRVWGHEKKEIPAPQATTSPDFRMAWNEQLHSPVTWVNLWNWLWAGPDVWHPITGSLSVRGVSVTVRVKPVGLRIDPGNGDPVVVCKNTPGVPFYPAADGVAHPGRDPDGPGIGGCGWKYHEASSLTHPLVARIFIDWEASWTSNAGASGNLGEITTWRDTEPFVVAERRVVLVPSPGEDH